MTELSFVLLREGYLIPGLSLPPSPGGSPGQVSQGLVMPQYCICSILVGLDPTGAAGTTESQLNNSESERRLARAWSQEAPQPVRLACNARLPLSLMIRVVIIAGNTFLKLFTASTSGLALSCQALFAKFYG